MKEKSKLETLRGLKEWIEAGDGIVGSTPQSRAMLADMQAEIEALEAGQEGGGNAGN